MVGNTSLEEGVVENVVVAGVGGSLKRKDASCAENSKKDSARNFVWEDNEVELLLICTVDYKTQ